MEKVYIAYQCDNWLSTSSRKMIMVASSKLQALTEIYREIKKVIENEEGKLDTDDPTTDKFLTECLNDLEEYNQTHSMSKYNVNYLIEEVPLDENIL